MRKVYVLILLVLVNVRVTNAQFTATYDFANVTTTSGTTDPTPVPIVSGLSFGSFTATGTPANPNATGRFSFTDWSLGATNGSDVFTGGIVTTEYYQVTITPNANVTLDVNSITFTIQRSGTGIRQYSVRGSIDAFGANLPASINPTNANLSVVATNIFQITDASTTAQTGSTLTLDATYDNITSAVTFRFYGYNAEASGGTFSIDNVVINGTATYTGPITNYYSKSTGNLTTLATWGTNTDGTGTAPSSFTGDGSIFNVVNRASVTLDANWTVNGSSSKVITGDGVAGTELIIPNTATLTGFVDVTNLSTLRLENSTLPSFGTFATGSTVNFAQIASPFTIPTNSVAFHHLRVTNGIKTLASGTITVNGNMVVDAASGFNGSGTPFTTVNIAGDFTLANGAAFEPVATGEGNRMTIICTGSGSQTFSGGDLYFFRIQTLTTPVTTLDIALGSSLILANPSGGGLNLQQTTHTLSLNGNNLTMYGAAIFSASHTGTISGNTGSDITINKTAGFGSIGSTGFTTGFQVLGNFNYNCAGFGTNNLSLLSSLTVTGNLTMTAGLIQLGVNNLIVSGTALGSTTSYVKTNGTGTLTLPSIGAVAESFPIGNSTYNPLIISNGSGSDFSARVADGINDPSGAIPTDAVQRTWYINASANTPGVDITYQYNLAECVNAATTQPTNMEILQSDYSVWHLVPGNTTILSVGTDPYTVAGTGMTIPLASTPYTLGVTNTLILSADYFIAAKAQKQNNNARITWAVNTVDNVNIFEIQRSAGNGGFTTIGTVTASAAQMNYEFTDMSPAGGTNLYRIRVNRSSGAARYSNTVAVIMGTKGLLITGVTPNPAQDRTSITISAATKGTVTFELYNMAGVPVKRWVSAVAEGTNSIPVQTASLPAGLYNIIATNNEARSVIRFIKQ